jgi:hypothetical protein
MTGAGVARGLTPLTGRAACPFTVAVERVVAL